MARYVHKRGEMSELRKHTSNTLLAKLRQQGAKPVTPLGDLRKIIKQESVRRNVPIVISSKHFRGKFRNDDGLATRPKGKSKILIHPIVQYNSRKFIKELIGHEHDHIKAYEKRNEVTLF